MKKNILLYKTSRAFTRFIKNVYLENYKMCGYNRYNIESSGNEEYILAFIMIENLEDLVVFSSIYARSQKVYIISNLSEMNEMISKLCDVTIFDNNLLRNDIIKLIDRDLDLNKSIGTEVS